MLVVILVRQQYVALHLMIMLFILMTCLRVIFSIYLATVSLMKTLSVTLAFTLRLLAVNLVMLRVVFLMCSYAWRYG